MFLPKVFYSLISPRSRRGYVHAIVILPYRTMRRPSLQQ